MIARGLEFGMVAAIAVMLMAADVHWIAAAMVVFSLLLAIQSNR